MDKDFSGPKLYHHAVGMKSLLAQRPLTAKPPTDLPDFRLAADITRASRCARVWPKAKPRGLAAKAGLRYEERVHKELLWHCQRGNAIRVEHNPWFNFHDVFGTSNCSPDFLLWLANDKVIVIEVKLTWVAVAAHKLTDLYAPVIGHALQGEANGISPLVICRNITREAPTASYSLREALASPFRLLQWPDNGRMQW